MAAAGVCKLWRDLALHHSHVQYSLQFTVITIFVIDFCLFFCIFVVEIGSLEELPYLRLVTLCQPFAPSWHATPGHEEDAICHID